MRSFLSGVNSRPEGTSIRIARVRVSCTTACPISRMRTSWPARIAISELVSPGRSPPEKLMRMILFMQKAKASACVAGNRPAHSDYQLRGTLQLAQPCCGCLFSKRQEETCQHEKRAQSRGDMEKLQAKLSPARCVEKRAARCAREKAGREARSRAANRRSRSAFLRRVRKAPRCLRSERQPESVPISMSKAVAALNADGRSLLADH